MDTGKGPPPPPPPPPPPASSSSSPLLIISSSSLEPKIENIADDDPPPRPLESLYETPVPPFLSKTYDLVDDLNLDPIISWAPAGHSFVVWDLPEFSHTVLPRHFKHNNFSSFVRQLNTYGFRKIGTDRWEFANEDFLRGNKSLLKKISRRRSCQVQQIGTQVVSSAETGKPGTESEIAKLKREKDLLMGEVVQLRQEHVITVQQINALHRRMQSAEVRQKQMVSFLAKVLQNPIFLDHLKKLKEQRESAPMRVRRKFLKQQQQQLRQSESDNSLDEQIVKCRLDCQTEENSSIPLLPVIEHGESSAFSLAGYEYDENKRFSDRLFQGLVDEVGSDIGEQDLFGGLAGTEDLEAKNEMSSETDVGFINTCYLISLPGDKTPEALVSNDYAPPSGESIGRSDSEISAFKGKNVMNFETTAAAADDDSGIGYLTTIPDDISQEAMFQDAIAPSSDFVNEVQFWNVGVEAGSLTSGHKIWDNIDLVDAQEVEVSDGSCSLWDVGLHTLEEVLDINKYVGGESSFQEHRDVDGHPSEDSPRKLEP